MVDRIKEISNNCLAARIRILNRLVTRIYDAELRQHGVKVSQLGILVAVGRAVEIRPTDLCRLLQMEKSTLSRDLEHLLGRKWIEKIDGDDGRSYSIRLTASGRKLVESTFDDWKCAQRQAERLIDGKVMKALKLDRLMK